MLDYIIVLAYLLFMLSLGLYAGRHVSNIQDFAVAKRQYSSWVIFATLSASFIGGGFTTGNAEKVFLYGIVNVVALWGFSIKEMLVGHFIAPRFTPFAHALTVGDVMAVGFGEKIKPIIGMVSFLLCAAIVGAQVGAMGYLAEILFGLPQHYGILIGTGLVICYVTVGGIHAVVLTDLVQFALLCIGLPLTLLLGIVAMGGVSSWWANIPADHLTFLGPFSWVELLSLFFLFMLGETLVPPYVQRMLIAKNVRTAARGTFFSGLFSIPFLLLTGLLGLLALTLDAQLNANLAIFHTVDMVLPIGLRGLVMGALLAVVMSTADSYINAASLAVVHDVLLPLLRKSMNPRRQLLWVRLMTVVVGLVAIIFAIKIHSILDILLLAYNFWAPVVLPSLLAVVFGLRAHYRLFLLAAVSGVVANIMWDNYAHMDIDGLLMGVLAHAMVIITYILITNKQKQIKVATLHQQNANTKPPPERRNVDEQ